VHATSDLALWPAPYAQVPIHAEVRIPGSKSLTNRALVIAALADGPSKIRRPLRSRDTELMIAGLQRLGVDIDDAGPIWEVRPRPLVGETAIDCGLAGTVARFMPPVAALAVGPVAFDGDAHMRARPIGEVLTALRALGVEIADDGRGTLPFTVQGRGVVPGGKVVLDASASSQFISALLLSGARYEAGVDVRHDGKPVPSLPHIEMTVAMLRRHGVGVDDTDANRWAVTPGAIRALDHDIEPDLSNAAPFLALAAVSGGSILVPDWPASTTQPGAALIDVLTQMGCSVELDDAGLRVTGTGTIAGVDLDLHDIGELTPVIAALCALAESPSTLRGVAHIRGHETDRIHALNTELTRLGADVTEHEDGLDLRPAKLQGGIFHTYADHRMAHAGVVIGSAVAGVLVENIETTSKTFPAFAAAWASLW
jgi:3-phosphoshikimate 1-carboxyvinyltransferase